MNFHQIHPISGQGGAAAIEDAAVLVNALQRMLSQTRYPSTNDFQDVFAETQRARENRTSCLLELATKQQQIEAMESIFTPLIVRYVLPNLTGDAICSTVAPNIVQGPRIKLLPVPHRERYIPYNDELPAEPLGDVPIASACFVLLYSILFYVARLFSSESSSPTVPIHFGLPEHYLNTTINYYTPSGRGSTDWSLSSVTLLTPILLIWNIEMHRHGNIRALAWYAHIFYSSMGLAN